MMSTSGGGDTAKAIFERNKLDYEDMKLRLLETEQKLLNLRKLEEEVQSVTSETTDKISSVSNYRSVPYKSWQDDSVSSASTLPGSYRGFAHHKISHSTPSKKQRSTKSNFLRDAGESDSSADSTKENRGNVKYERKLLLQNQRLLLEVERLIGDLHSSKLENASLLKETEVMKKIPDLEERIEELSSESHAQDKALRDAERHLELGAKHNTDLQRQVDELTNEVSDLRAEIDEHKETKKAIENQRDEAIQNLVEVQESWEDYQRRAKEKHRKMEDNEDSLQDSLASLSGQRDDLLDQLAEVQTTVASQEAQISRLLREVEVEVSSKEKYEEENHKLQRQLDQLTAQLNNFDQVSRKGDILRKEKLELEKEVSEHRLMAQDISQLLDLFRNKHKTGEHNMNGNNLEFDLMTPDPVLASDLAELNRNNNGLGENSCSNNTAGKRGSSSNNLGELRSLFCNMDSEITRLRTDLKQRDLDDKTYINLREELNIIMEKAEKGLAQNTELECVVQNLEDNKKCLEAKLEECCRALEDRVRQSQMLDTRLSERNRQVICIQEESNEKSQKILSLETQIREWKMRFDEMTNQMECPMKLEAAMKRIKELEDQVACQEKSFCELQCKYLSETKDLKCECKKYEKKICCFNDQIYEFERQLETMSGETGNLREKLKTCTKAKDEEHKIVREKEFQICQLTQSLEEERQNHGETDKLHCQQISNLQTKLQKAQTNITELESALSMCKQEMNKHLLTMEEVRKHMDSEIQQRDCNIKQLNECVRRSKEDLACKSHEINGLEHGIMTLKTKIDQMCKSLQEAENAKNCLGEKLRLCEKKALAEKSCCLKEMEELERKLTSALNNLSVATGEMAKQKQQLAEKTSLNDCLTLEKNRCSRDLALCQKKAQEKADLLAKMDKDNTELCTQLQHKMECIKDLETALCNKELDLKNCTRCLEELNQKFNSVGSENSKVDGLIKSLKDKVQACNDELAKKTRFLFEVEDQLKSCRLEVKQKQDEINMLNTQMNECNCKLQDRVVKVEELEKAIDMIHKDTEKRMKRVDEQLRRYECELSEKAKQLTDMDECVTTCQQKLTEKVNQCCQLEQRNHRLCCDLQLMEAKYKELDEQRECCNKNLNESKGENAEITQQLRVTREELQVQHCELVETRQSLLNYNRQVEQIRRELDTKQGNLEQKECELKKLSADRNELMSKIGNLQCQMERAGQQAQQQFTDYKNCMEKELSNCRGHCGEVEEQNCMLSQKLSATTRQLAQVEKTCHHKLDAINRELEDLLNRLSDRDDQISHLKDCINQKEAEIMKLKLRLCSCQNSCNTNNCNTNNPPFDPNHEGQDDLDSSLAGRLAAGRTAEDTGDRLSRTERRGSQTDQASPDVIKDQANDRNSLGVSEVQERLRSNQRLQIEIEKQLRSLEDDIDELPQA